MTRLVWIMNAIALHCYAMSGDTYIRLERGIYDSGQPNGQSI